MTGVLFTGVLLRPDPRPNPQFFGRTDLRISISRVKFDVEVDFDVRSAVALQNSVQIGENQNFDPKFDRKTFLASKNETSGIV